MTYRLIEELNDKNFDRRPCGKTLLQLDTRRFISMNRKVIPEKSLNGPAGYRVNSEDFY